MGTPSVVAVMNAARRRAEHWRKIRSTNPLERFNREIGRRTDVVGIFPDDRSLIRVASMLAIEPNDEWLVGRRYLSAASMGRPLTYTTSRDLTPSAAGACSTALRAPAGQRRAEPSRGVRAALRRVVAGRAGADRTRRR
jgi:hypothetical protein